MRIKEPRFKISKWIMLGLAIISNAFIIVYSCLSNRATSVLAKPFNTFFTSLVNAITHKEVENIPLVDIDAHLSDEQSYVYNYIPGYQVDEIPLGSAKQIECAFSPTNATNKAVTYTASPADAVQLNQSGSAVTVIGMKVGKVVITAKSNENKLVSTVTVNVVDTVAPVNFKATIQSQTIPIGTTQTINFDIDGGPLRHDELINFRYYNIRKLTYSSNKENIATVDNDGVIHPIHTGKATISVTNGAISESFDIEVTSGSKPSPYANLSISGSDICYGNDMLMSQSSEKYKYQLTPMDGGVELKPTDFVWSTSNELLVRVDKYGVMRGFRKSIVDDETATVYAKSKLTEQTISFEITVKNQLPTQMTLLFRNGDVDYYEPRNYTAMTGDVVKVIVFFIPSSQIKNVDVVSTDESVVSCTNEGTGATLHMLKEGSCSILVTPAVDPDLAIKVDIEVVKAGAISIQNFEQFTTYIRKSLGHAAVFMLAQIFAYLTLYMFFYEKKWWFYSSISVGGGFFLCCLSELIQFFVPSRDGTILDVFIDFAGVVVGAALTFLGIFIVKKIKEKRKTKKELEAKND